MLSGFRPVFFAIAARSIDFAISIRPRSAARECEYGRFGLAMLLPDMMVENTDKTDRARYAIPEALGLNALDTIRQTRRQLSGILQARFDPHLATR
jgi:hypothetical protein